MDSDVVRGARGAVAAWSLAALDLPDVDEFDLDLRLGEHGRWLGMPLGAQSDVQGCLPTGGGGAGTTCDTNNPTCPGTCAGLATCPNTQCNTCGATVCVNTCPNTQCNTCGATVCAATCPRTECNTCGVTVCAATCPRTDCGNTCFCQTQNRHVPNCQEP
jgi:hypothetical protein